MNLNRRNFFKIAGAAGLTLATGPMLNAREKNETDKEFKAILFDSFRCLGCQACERACAKENGLPKPEEKPKVGLIRETNDKRRTVVNTFNTQKGEFNIKKQCMHCNEPACAAACLTQAMFKTKEGPVIWRGDKCMGCRFCMVSCPFDVPKFEYHSSNPEIVKCTMCYDRLIEGKIPACVNACTGDALMFGTRRELIKEARKRILENPKDYVDYIYGEHEAGGTSFLYLSSVPPDELGLKNSVQKKSYPELTKGFLYSVPTIFVLWPSILLGIYESTKNNRLKPTENE
ncbi:MAG: 4Fe-4S dicluster domain-containing protein [Bacteroidales bacterium]